MTLTSGPKKWPFSFLFLALFTPYSALCLNLTYVAPETRQELKALFEASHHPVPSEHKSLWNCEMFGMRTGLQYEKDLDLYSFTKKAGGKEVINDGLSPNRSFELKRGKTELFSQGTQVAEYIRFPSDEVLISKMVHVPTQKTLAFAKCRKTPLTKRPGTAETVAAHD